MCGAELQGFCDVCDELGVVAGVDGPGRGRVRVAGAGEVKRHHAQVLGDQQRDDAAEHEGAAERVGHQQHRLAGLRPVSVHERHGSDRHLRRALNAHKRVDHGLTVEHRYHLPRCNARE